MKKGTRTCLWRGAAAALASVLSFTLCGTGIAYTYASFINSRLGTSNYQVQAAEGGSGVDSNYFESEFSSLEELIAAKEALAEEIAGEGAVLFKNTNEALPLDKAGETVTVWGLNSTEATLGGLIGSTVSVNTEAGQESYGLVEALQAKGFAVNDTMQQFYLSDVCKPYYRVAAFFGQEVAGHSLVPAFGAMYEEASTYVVGELDPTKYTDEALNSANDTTALVFLSRDSSEASDYSTEMTATNGDSFETPLSLSEFEKAMIQLAKEHSNGKVIVVLNSDIPMEIEELKQDPDVDAILWAGLPGAYGFLGVADVLSGDVNPSGRIADTYAVSSTSSPAMVNFGVYTYTNSSVSDAGQLTDVDKGDWYVVQNEGIYVGYKYYETRYEDQVLGQGNATEQQGSSTGNGWNYADEVSYPFGYGLSYTTFSQTLKSVDLTVGGTGTAVVDVTNTGSVAGKCAVQLYVQVPYISGGVEKSSIQLINFGKTDVLQPGATETVTIEFDPAYMASYDQNVVKEDGTQGAWILDEGTYYFTVGNGAHQALNNIIANKTGSTEGLVKTTEDEAIQPENVVAIQLGYDCETYSENVQNALQDADINNLVENTVEYVTRSDWTKGWTEITELTATDDMLVNLTNSHYQLTENGDGLTWGVDAGMQLIDMVELDDEGNITGVVDVNDPLWDTLIEQLELKDAVNFLEKAGDEFEVLPVLGLGVVNTDDGPIGFVSDQLPGYAAKWTESEAEEPTYVSADDGYSGYYMATFPTAPVVAATFNQELIEREGEILGEDSLWTNVAGIIGPGTNIHRVPYCSRNHEYYSEDSMLCNLMTVAVSKGGQSKGLMVEPKHFAFNHQEANRSGVSTFFNEQAGRENELRAFQGACSANYADGIMTAFNRVGTLFAGAHEGINVQILRNEWDYTGWIVSDMVNGADYMNWRDNIFGGGGGCLTTDAYSSSEIGSATSEENLALIAEDTAFQQEVKQALKYYLYTIAGSNAMNGVQAGSSVKYVLTDWQIGLIALNAVLGVLTLGSLAMYGVSIKKSKAKA